MNECTAECDCRKVIKGIYRDLRRRRMPQDAVYNAAHRVFCLHHGEVPEAWARRTVSRLLLP